jgi:hypothetical protein
MRTGTFIFGLIGAASAALGAPTRVEAMTTLASSDRLRLFLVALVALFALMGAWSALSRAGMAAFRGPVARNLFLGVRVGGGGGDFTGHLLSLGPRGATLVSPKALSRGARVTLDLGGLSEGEGGAATLTGEVTNAHVIAHGSGDAPTHLVTVRFKGMSPAARLPLMRVVNQLARSGRVAEA